MATRWAYAATSEEELDQIDDILCYYAVRTVIDQIQVKAKLSAEPFQPAAMCPSDFVPPLTAWSLDQLTSQTFILINCNPGLNQSELLLQSCLKTRSCYLDLIPDRSFTSLVYRQYDKEARKQGICILLGCSWERVCGDAGVLSQWKYMTDCLPAQDYIQVESAHTCISIDGSSSHALLHWNFLDSLRGVHREKIQDENKQNFLPACYPSYPVYQSEDYHYSVRTQTLFPTNQIVADDVVLTYASSQSVFTEEWYRAVVLWIRLCFFLFLCKYLLFSPVFKWLAQTSSKESSYYDYHDMLVHCQLVIDRRIAHVDELELGLWRRRLRLPDGESGNDVRQVSSSCHVQGSSNSMEPASILACILCLIHQKHWDEGGCISPGQLGLPLLKELQRLGVEFEVYIREENKD